MAIRGDARERLLDAGIRLIREHGLAATTVDDVCRAARVTKGAFFHHFASKEVYAAAVAERWVDVTSGLFATAAYHDLDDPFDRVMAYLDLREELIGDDRAAEYSCLAGTMVQEAYGTQTVRDACAAAIFGHSATLEADLAAALDRSATRSAAGDADGDADGRSVEAAGLARFTQAVLQGSFILAKAGDTPAFARESLKYLRDYLERVLASTDRQPRAAGEEAA